MKNLEINKKQILKSLRENSGMLSKHPNSCRVLFFKKHEMVNGEAEEFDIEVRCKHKNYISLVRELYDADNYGTIRKGALGSNDFSYISALQILVKQLEKDEYLFINKQECSYHTEFGRKMIPDGQGGLNDDYDMNAKRFFSAEEQRLLETSIELTTKGQSQLESWREKINSEPIASISFIIAAISLIFSILK